MKTKALPRAIAAVLMLGVAGAAQANFKGVSINEITNFNLSAASGDFTVVGASVQSVARAQWSPNEENNTAAGTTPNLPASLDPEVADCGPAGCDFGGAGLENVYEQLADPSVDNWARGDAIVGNTDITNNGAASNLAEVVASPGTFVALGDVTAEGTNSLAGLFNIETGGGELQFEFQADPFMEVWTPGGLDVSSVTATLDFVISITEDATQEVVFEWQPGGSAGGIVGGTEELDPFSLNRDLFSQNGFGNLVYDPVGENLFRATTFDLDAGTYTLAISMSEAASGQQERGFIPVPVPATLALLGAGLIGLGVARRRGAKG